MASNPASEIASAIQSLSIKRDPSPHHDINPSTSADTKIPAKLVHGEDVHSPAHSPSRSHSHSLSSASSSSEIPSDILKPRPRRKSFPPMPDFRFEQSYLASIKNADTPGKVVYITVRDQVLLPLVQGIVWNLLMTGWRFWNRGTKFQGQTFGARIRKWWWGVNNWKLPESVTRNQSKKDFTKGAEDVSDVHPLVLC